MTLFESIANKCLLTELKQNRYEDIKKAVNNVLRVRMSYNDKKGGKGKQERFILPVAFGLNSKGEPVVRAYQTAGSSKRGITTPPNTRKEPKWKMFKVDNIYSWSNGKRSFKDYKDELIARGLNVNGDKHMTKLFAITPFANDDVQVANTMDTNLVSPEPITKQDVQPTAQLQNKATTDPSKFTSAEKSRQNDVDNTEKTAYTTSKLNAPETAPVSKAEVGNNVAGTKSDAETAEKMYASNTTPVTKDDVKAGENAADIKSKFDDMNRRMDNLYKDEEENEEDVTK